MVYSNYLNLNCISLTLQDHHVYAETQQTIIRFKYKPTPHKNNLVLFMVK